MEPGGRDGARGEWWRNLGSVAAEPGGSCCGAVGNSHKPEVRLY